MKRKLALILTATVVAASLVGCKKELPETSGAVESTPGVIEEGADLTLWTENVKYGEAIAENFTKKYPEVKVTVEEAPGMGGSMDKLALDGPAGNGPDVLIVPHDKVTNGIDSGIITPLSDEITKELNEKVTKNALDVVSREGELYGSPVSIETGALFYNKDLVTEPANTFEEIYDMAKEYNSSKENKFVFLLNPNHFYDAYALLSSGGFNLFGENNNDENNPGFDSPEFLLGLENLAKLKEIIPINSKDLMDETVPNQFKEGKTPYILGGPWNIDSFKKAGVNFGVATVPTINGKETKTMGGIQAACVSAYTDYPNASMELAKFMAEEEGAQILYDTQYKITALKDTSKVAGLNEDKDLGVFAEQFKTSVPTPTISRMSYIYPLGDSVLSTVFDGKLTPEQGVEKAKQEWNALIATE